jgi:hypothetical protein
MASSYGSGKEEGKTIWVSISLGATGGPALGGEEEDARTVHHVSGPTHWYSTDSSFRLRRAAGLDRGCPLLRSDIRGHMWSVCVARDVLRIII